MTTKTALKTARAKVNAETFGTEAWELAMKNVRVLCVKLDSETGLSALPFCSVDSGIHPTRLSDGRIINA